MEALWFGMPDEIEISTVKFNKIIDILKKIKKYFNTFTTNDAYWSHLTHSFDNDKHQFKMY